MLSIEESKEGQNDIILKFHKSGHVNRWIKGGKQNDIIAKLQKSDAVNRRNPGGKQNDIILQLQKSRPVKLAQIVGLEPSTAEHE